MKMDDAELKKAVETLLFITDHPLGLAKIGETVGERDHDRIAGAVKVLREEHEGRAAAVQILEIAGGFQMATRSDYQKFVRNLYKEKMTMRLSTAALETISIIAYKQPITRAEIEEVRGVEVIAALETLLEKGLIRVTGRKESVGRPLLYGTTPDFLRQFGLRGVKDLPPIESFTPPEAAEAVVPAPESESGTVSASGRDGARPEPESALGPEPAAEPETQPEPKPEPEPPAEGFRASDAPSSESEDGAVPAEGRDDESSEDASKDSPDAG